MHGIEHYHSTHRRHHAKCLALVEQHALQVRYSTVYRQKCRIQSPTDASSGAGIGITPGASQAPALPSPATSPAVCLTPVSITMLVTSRSESRPPMRSIATILPSKGGNLPERKEGGEVERKGESQLTARLTR